MNGPKRLTTVRKQPMKAEYMTHNTSLSTIHQWARASGFTETIPIIPVGAKLHEDSRVAETAKGKAPGMFYSGAWDGTAGWPEFQMSDVLAAEFDALGANVGLKMGWRYCALDVDITDETTATAIRAALLDNGVKAPIRVGAAPKFLLLFKVAEPAQRTDEGIVGGIMRRQYQVHWPDSDIINVIDVMGMSRKGRPTQAVIAGGAP